MLMTIFAMFFIELMASRYEFFGHSHDQDLESRDPAQHVLRKSAAENKSNSDLSTGSKYLTQSNICRRAFVVHDFLMSLAL